jgi:hypothetical protein
MGQAGLSGPGGALMRTPGFVVSGFVRISHCVSLLEQVYDVDAMSLYRNRGRIPTGLRDAQERLCRSGP